MLKVNERLEPLGNKVEIIVNDTHHFSTDTILLSHFASPKSSDCVIELGTGCGTIPLLWCREHSIKELIAVDIQEDAIDMLKRSIAHNEQNGLINCSCITPLRSDLKDLKGKCEFGHFNVVVCNPPYKLSGSGIKNPEQQKTVARHEESCTLDDICEAASKLLQFSGRFCICQRPERLADVMESMRKFDIEPKRLRLVQQRLQKEPKLFLLEGRYKGNKGFMQVMPTLFIEDEHGDFSHEMKEIYGLYKEGRI
ncbi:MAG: methyltransferase domain-containing protein [Ruminococcaceae bacterium]|nr:methyltransferase domain-containing protein [Oscillospiraceae bacterium]